MWLKVLSLFILCSIAFGANASPFGHAPELENSYVSQNAQAGLNAFNTIQSVNETQFTGLCIEEKSTITDIECCHLDTCSVLLISRIKAPSAMLFLKPYPALKHWLYKPISNLKKPPKFIAV